MKKKLLFFISHYLPGYKAGGPITSVSNIVDLLGNDAEIFIITQDRDLGDDTPYSNIRINHYEGFNNAKVKYLPISYFSFGRTLKEIKNCQPKIIYLNSLFSWTFSIRIVLMKWLKLFTCKQIILAPRGELSAGALEIKKTKKKFFLKIAIFFKLYENILWQATSFIEKRDIQRNLGEKADIVVVPNLPRKVVGSKGYTNYKAINKLRIVFLSRISPKKNLLYALNCLNAIKGNDREILFDIYGPIEDEPYWEKCQRALVHSRKSIYITYKGSVQPKFVNECLQKYHLFFLPTLGENYGHVIFESFAAGCPVLISDQTPWRNLRQLQVGRDIDLAKQYEFIEAIEEFVKMSENKFLLFRQHCVNHAKKTLTHSNTFERTRKLFLDG
jgi:glycosyltransferase involved in cell wall biosynthesis